LRTRRQLGETGACKLLSASPDAALAAECARGGLSSWAATRVVGHRWSAPRRACRSIVEQALSGAPAVQPVSCAAGSTHYQGAWPRQPANVWSVTRTCSSRRMQDSAEHHTSERLARYGPEGECEIDLRRINVIIAPRAASDCRPCVPCRRWCMTAVRLTCARALTSFATTIERYAEHDSDRDIPQQRASSPGAGSEPAEDQPSAQAGRVMRCAASCAMVRLPRRRPASRRRWPGSKTRSRARGGNVVRVQAIARRGERSAGSHTAP